MPIYTYLCDSCDKERDEYRKIANRHNAPRCCGSSMTKIIPRQAVHSDLDPYYDDNLEGYVKSKQHRRELMKQQGVIEKIGKGWI